MEEAGEVSGGVPPAVAVVVGRRHETRRLKERNKGSGKNPLLVIDFLVR